jgi:hypothetical protein
MMEPMDSSETSVLAEPNGVTFQKNTFFIVTILKNSDLT